MNIEQTTISITVSTFNDFHLYFLETPNFKIVHCYLIFPILYLQIAPKY